MTFPTPYSVGWHTYSEGADTAHNEPTPTYTPALVDPGTSRDVIGWGPVTVVSEPDSERIMQRRKLYVPSGFTAGPRDVVEMPDGDWEVDGHVDDQSNGFHGWSPGDVVWLKRTQR